MASTKGIIFFKILGLLKVQTKIIGLFNLLNASTNSSCAFGKYKLSIFPGISVEGVSATQIIILSAFLALAKQSSIFMA